MEFFSLGVTVCNDWEYCYSFSLLNQFDLCFVQSDVTLNTVLPLSPLSLLQLPQQQGRPLNMLVRIGIIIFIHRKESRKALKKCRR